MLEATYAGEKASNGGVISPMMTITTRSQRVEDIAMIRYPQLFSQFEAVETATPLLRMDSGRTSLGKIHAMGPILKPYAAVKIYVHLDAGQQSTKGMEL